MKTKILFLLFCVSVIFSCKKNNDPAAGTGSLYNYDNLTGTKWRLYQYKLDSSTNPIAMSDTLNFTSDENYTYNGQAFTYHLEKSEYYNNCRLTLNNTPFGNVNGYPAFDFKSYGSILGIPFTQLTLGSQATYNFWLQKI